MEGKMYFLYLICVLLLFSSSQFIKADDKSDCYVENITDEEWKTQKVFPDVINDVENKKSIFKGKYDNITSVGECNKYFCINLNETTKQLEIITSDDFSSIDGNGEYERANEILEIPRTIELVCSTGNRSLTVKINVKDTNNHAPSFSQPSYEYVLPMPMSPKVNITNFGAQIKVTDVDFSNKDITFSPDYKGLSTKTSFGEKGSYSYILDLEFAAVKKLTSPTTFSLTATDTGTPPKSSTVNITFKIDEDVSEPPSFTQPSYLYKYDEKTKSISPADADGQGAMLEYSRDKLQCTLKGDNSELFKVEVKEKEVKVSVVTPFDETKIDQQLVQLTIECSVIDKDIGTSTADVIISFPKSTVGFSTKKYTAQYEIKGDDHSVNMTDVITLTGSLEDGVIKVEDYLNLKDYLEVKKKSEGVWTLNKIKNLEENILKNTEINFIIKLYNKDIELDTAFILLVLPNGEEGVDFDQSFFTGDYKFDDDGRGTMEAITITLNNKNLDIDGCDLEKNKYSQYFEVNCGNVDELKLIKKSDIPRDLLQDGTVPLTMWMDITLGNIKRRIETAILLNLEKAGETSPTTLSTTTPSTTSTSTTQSSPAEESDCSHTGWIIAVIVLLLLLIVYVIVTVIYYVRRIRNRTETEIPLPSTRMPMNGPLSKKRSSDKFKDVSTRRPTGFIRYNPDQDRSSLDSENGDARNEVEENTNRNRFMNEPEENFRKISEGNSKRRSIGFAIPPPPPPET